jgi:archaemetzincin
VIKKPESKYRDWGVFGLGSCPGKSCVVSTFRVKTTNKKLASERMQKIAIHEVGHNLGLKHCPDKSCVMTDAVERVATIDNALKQLCHQCERQLSRRKLF